MENRGQKRSELDDELPADKRTCSSLDRPSSSKSSPPETNVNSTTSTLENHNRDGDMETSSSSGSASARSERGSPYGSCDSDDDDEDDDFHAAPADHRRHSSLREIQRRRASGDHAKIENIISCLRDENDYSGQLAALTQLCEILSFGTKDSVTSRLADQLAPSLVKLSKCEINPDIMLVAIRAMTYLADIYPQASEFLVRHDAVPALCERLMLIEYMDIAEQCLQALEKISREQPLACLESGGLTALLSFIDFFCTSVQRTALSAVANICKELPSDSPATFMEAVPRLSNLLFYEDQQLVETSASCLIKIVDRVENSPNTLTELCSHGLVRQAANIIDLNGRTTLSQPMCSGLIGMLAKLASGCAEAVRTLFEIDIGRVMRDMLSSVDHLHGAPSPRSMDRNCLQVREILRLLNELLPPLVRAKEDELVASKEKIVVEQPMVLRSFGMNILPVLIKVVNAGANLNVSYGCLSVINKLVYFCDSDTLLELVETTNMPSFLIGVFTRKDNHILTLALEVTESVLKKLSNVLLASFVKEGLLFAIDALIKPDKCSQFMFPVVSDIQPLGDGRGAKKCLCYAYVTGQSLPASESRICRLNKDSIHELANRIRTDYFSSELQNLDDGVTHTLQTLREFSAELNDLPNQSISNIVNPQYEETFCRILQQVLELVSGNEAISTFEFIESGIIRALVNYLLDGLYLREKIDATDVLRHLNVIQQRFAMLAKMSYSSVHPVSKDSALSLLIRKLQSALSALENFPGVVSSVVKLRGYAAIPSGRYTAYPCIRARFVRGEEETGLCEYSKDVVTVDPFCSVESIERYLWPKVRERKTEGTTSADQGQNSVKVVHFEASSDAGSVKGKNPDLMEAESVCPTVSQMQGFTEELHLSSDADMQSQSMKIETSSTFISNAEDDVKRNQSSASCSTSKHLPNLAIFLEGTRLDCSFSLYQELIEHQMKSQDGLCDGAKLWSETYTLNYKRAVDDDNGRCERNYCWFTGCASDGYRIGQKFLPSLWGIFVSRLVSNLAKSSPVNDILFLLKILDMVNRFIYHFISLERALAFVGGQTENLDSLKIMVPSLARNQFVNTKLSQKLEQQMQDSLALSTGALPSWCNQLMSTCPFLFTFEARCKYFQLAAFRRLNVQSQPASHDDSGTRTDRRPANRNMPRKKVLVNRDHILESAAHMMEMHAREKSVLEVEYCEEVGTGLGPTLEFYTLVGQEFQKAGFGMWRESTLPGEDALSLYSRTTTSFLGLFPRPWSPNSGSSGGIEFSDVLKRFVLLGQIVAKAVQDGRVLDIPFSNAFYKLILGEELGLYDIKSFDAHLGRTLLELKAVVDKHNHLRSICEESVAFESGSGIWNTRIEDLCLDFTLPGYPDYPLSSRLDHVTIDNLEEFIFLVEDATIHSGISRQVEAFKSGFNQVFPIKHLQIFTEEELEQLLCGESDVWRSHEMLDHIEFNHGYTANSPPVINLMEIMREFDYQQQRAFLQFVTGAPRLPPGGLAALSPKLTIVRKHSSNSADLDLPSVMTCVNYLKLPPYSTKEKMKEKLLYAITEGQGSFHLS